MKLLFPLAFSGSLATVGLLAWGCGARTGLGALTCSTTCNVTTTTVHDRRVCPSEGDVGEGQCTHQPVPVGTACDDGDPCTSGDACTADGTCTGTPNNACLRPIVEATCPAGCASGTPDFPAAIPLVPPALPADCSGGFEMNNPPQLVFMVPSISPAGAQARTLDIEIATYKAPDHISITAIGRLEHRVPAGRHVPPADLQQRGPHQRLHASPGRHHPPVQGEHHGRHDELEPST